MKFHDYVTLALNKKFKWGEHDCVTWAIGWGSIVLDKNLLEPFGTWDDRRSAIKAIKQVGGLKAAFSASGDLVQINPNFATDGDLFIVGKTACLLSGSQIIGTGKNGLVFNDRMLGKEAWTYIKK